MSEFMYPGDDMTHSEWQRYYQPANMTIWQGRNDSSPPAYFYQQITALNILTDKINTQTLPTFALVGFCCDEGIRRNLGREGAAFGPEEIRQCLARLSLQHTNFICYDAGNVVCLQQNLEAAQTTLAKVIALLIKQQITPIVLGGGHELAWGHYQGIADAFPQDNLSIVNFDAHFDMRPLLANGQGSSGSPFLQIAKAHQHNNKSFAYYCIGIQKTGNIPLLFSTAKQYNVNVLSAEELYLANNEQPLQFINEVIRQKQKIYLSLCLDVFAAAYAPGVSAPQAFGLTPWQVIPLLRKLAASGQVVSYDIAELSPQFDHDQRTAKLAANFVYEIIYHHRSA